MASLLPLYIREYYKNDPLFKDSKIVTSAFNYGTTGVLSNENLINKIKFDQIAEEKLDSFKNDTDEGFVRIAIENSDAVIRGSESLSDEVSSIINNLKIPVLEYQPIEGFTEAYSDFYLNKVL
jgi:starch synthase